MSSGFDGDDDFNSSSCKIRKKDFGYDCQMAIDNSQNVLKTMRNLYDKRSMCDVILTVGNREHHAHRLILCASSDVFHAMLMKPEWSEWHESQVVLQELPQCEPIFHHFLEYLYTGKIIITHTNVMAILALADKYIVKSLTNLCVDYMSKHVPHAASHNVLFSWFQYTTTCGHDEVAEKCISFIKWNLEAVANNPEFGELDVDLLVNLLQQNDLVVYNEIVLFNCVMRWLDLQKVRLAQTSLSKPEVDQQVDFLIESVLPHIRFPMMTPREIADLLVSPLIKKYDFFVDKMALGMAFHLGQEEKYSQLLESDSGKLLFIPRLYTSDTFSTVISVDNVRDLPSYQTNTFVFSSHISAAECENDKVNEWVVDFYPKGVWFKKCYLIVWQGTLEVPEEILSTVRLSLTCRVLREENAKVRVGLLIYSRETDCDHIMRVIEKIHYFTLQDRVLNFDNVIPFEDLNPPATSAGGGAPISPYLIGHNRDKVKIEIVITPLTPNV